MRYEDRNSLPNLKAKLDVLSPDTYDILLTKWHMEAEAYIGLAWRGSEERPDPRIDLWALSAVANDQPAADNESVGRLLFKYERQAFRNTISRIAAQDLAHFHGYGEPLYGTHDALICWWASAARWQYLRAGLVRDIRQTRDRQQRQNHGLYGDDSDIARFMSGSSTSSLHEPSDPNDLSGTAPVADGTPNNTPEAETASNWTSVANLLECFERMRATEVAGDATDESDVASTWASTLDMLQSFRSVPALEDDHHADATSEVETEHIGAAVSGPITPDSYSLGS